MSSTDPPKQCVPWYDIIEDDRATLYAPEVELASIETMSQGNPHKEAILFARRLLSNGPFANEIACRFLSNPTYFGIRTKYREGYEAAIDNAQRTENLEKIGSVEDIVPILSKKKYIQLTVTDAFEGFPYFWECNNYAIAHQDEAVECVPRNQLLRTDDGSIPNTIPLSLYAPITDLCLP